MIANNRALWFAALVWFASPTPQDPSPAKDLRTAEEKTLDESLVDRGCVIMLNRTTLAVVDIASACGATAQKCVERATVAQSDGEGAALRDLAAKLKARKDASVALAMRLDQAVSEFEETTCSRRSRKLPHPGWKDAAFDSAMATMKRELEGAKRDYDALRTAVDECGLALPRWPRME